MGCDRDTGPGPGAEGGGDGPVTVGGKGPVETVETVDTVERPDRGVLRAVSCPSASRAGHERVGPTRDTPLGRRGVRDERPADAPRRVTAV